MSTRATYQFVPADQRFRPITTVYVHHDGYPEGAAMYLEDVETAEQFIRKNNKAEITDSHETHADTEYRYTIYEGNGLLNVEKRTNVNWSGGSVISEWDSIFDGFLTRFTENGGI